MVDKAHVATDRELVRMERHLSAIYNRASKELGESWKSYLAEIAKEIEPLQKAYDEAKELGDEKLIRKTGRELAAKKRERTLMDKHYQRMTEQLAQDISHVNERAIAYINGELPKVYSINYNSVAEEIDSQVKGISFELVDESTVKNLATTEETLLPYKQIDGKKDVRWNTKRVNSEVLQGILQGESMDKIAARLLKVENMNKASAIRNARTSVTGAENKGRMDMLYNAKEKGVLTHKVWTATDDERTRNAHAKLDGKEAEIDEAFENEFGKIMYPGDPTADAANVYNCRCTLTYKVVGFGTKTIETPSAETREQAYQLLTKDVGFYEVSPSMRYIDDETVVAQANQLAILNKRFNAIGNGYGGYIGAENSKQFVAATRGSFTNPNAQNLVFSFDSYAHGFDKVIKDVEKDISSGWSMPALESKYGVYTVTHEYGHILQNVLMSQRIDIEAYNASRGKIGLNAAKLKKFKKKTEDEAAKSIFSEILGVAREKNPNFSLKDNISGYGKSNYQEAFAEVFANSQLGKPNELGQAMLVWLERMGY